MSFHLLVVPNEKLDFAEDFLKNHSAYSAFPFAEACLDGG
jgi:hypothetical protein